ncbi:MAG TPA: helix-turn-helix domain-containing protein, partial [Aquamicrobium sp.]|nr:helix-turn-helix domain-containing protein [Aquamicrobium sp.]
MAKTSRVEIVAAARDLMRDRGYAGTSMKDVADRVGLLKSSLYSHFASKEALVPEVLSLTYGDIVGSLAPSGDWRGDYGAALGRLVATLTANRRCVGFHIAYGLDESSPAMKQAVGSFFLDLRSFLEELLRQGLDADLASSLALDTMTAIEGATLWLALYGNDAPMRAASAALLARADSYAAEPPDEDARRILDLLVGDWRLATLAEKRLAARA